MSQHVFFFQYSMLISVKFQWLLINDSYCSKSNSWRIFPFMVILYIRSCNYLFHHDMIMNFCYNFCFCFKNPVICAFHWLTRFSPSGPKFLWMEYHYCLIVVFSVLVWINSLIVYLLITFLLFSYNGDNQPHIYSCSQNLCLSPITMTFLKKGSVHSFIITFLFCILGKKDGGPHTPRSRGTA